MAIRLLSASSQYVGSSAGVTTTLPMTFGGWTRPLTLAVNQSVWGSLGSSTLDQAWSMNADVTTSSVVSLSYFNGTSTVGTAITTTGMLVAGAWTFVLFRLVSATSRWVTAMTAGGQISQVQSVVSVTPATMDRYHFGAYAGTSLGNYYNGDLAEMWVANGDPWPGGAMPDDLIRSLAYRGPWAMSNVAGMITQYRAGLNTGMAANDRRQAEGFVKDPLIQLTNFGGSPTVVDHPPLMEPYQRYAPISPRLVMAG